jgi:16S rRNA (uracil1498-N3)-methyltransferase
MHPARDRAPARVYCPGELAPGRTVSLPPPQAHHVARVLRRRAGDALTLFSGDGAEYAAVIESAAGRGVSVTVGERRLLDRESRLRIVLGQAISAGERMDYTIQKAVELGVAVICPIATARCVVRLDAARAAKRLEHWRSVAIAACEQCGRNRLPGIAAVESLPEWLAGGTVRGAALSVLLAPQAAAGLRELPAPEGIVVLLAGPEGGFTAGEQALARARGFVPVRLGPRVLRTETAAVAALAAMQALWGDF